MLSVSTKRHKIRKNLRFKMSLERDPGLMTSSHRRSRATTSSSRLSSPAQSFSNELQGTGNPLSLGSLPKKLKPSPKERLSKRTRRLVGVFEGRHIPHQTKETQVPTLILSYSRDWRERRPRFQPSALQSTLERRWPPARICGTSRRRIC